MTARTPGINDRANGSSSRHIAKSCTIDVHSSE
jgi:hypothetical protein